MKEANILTDQEKADLLAFMESCFNLTIPRNKERFGFISFHLYKYEKHSEPEWVFQIRWGSHQLFSKKHLKMDFKKEHLPQLYDIITKSKFAIIKNTLEFCQNQLNNIVLLEIGPELTKRMPVMNDYKMFVRKLRPLKNREGSECLTNLCLCISWLDETGEFQEFIHPIPYDAETGYFSLSPSEIVSKFQVYQDQVAF